MNTINTIAEKAYNNLPGKKDVALTEASIILMGTLVLEIIKLAQSCSKNEEEVAITVNYPTAANEKKLKAIVRKQLGWIQYWRHGAEYVEALKKTGQDTTLQDIKDGIAEIENNKV